MVKNESKFDGVVIRRIKDYCKVNDISLGKLADEAGLSQNQIYYISTGRQRLTLDMYVRICKALREPFSYFLKGEN